MKKKIFLILGAKSDIAKAVAYKFSSEGFNLQLAARNVEALNDLKSDIRIRNGVRVDLFELDILQYDLFDNFLQSLGKTPDVVLSAVGLLGNQYEDQKDHKKIQEVTRSNYEGPAILLNHFANLFEERGYGTIIGISSVAGDRGRASNYIYGSAKAGLTSFLSGLSNRLHRSDVKVITVKPGYVRTIVTSKMNLPALLTSYPINVANVIYKSLKSSKDVVYIDWTWYWIMLIIKHIPNILFKRLKL